MTTPRIVLATLALNEMEWLPKLYEQHQDWPGLVRWTFVEAADPVYARTNPEMVSHGLSVDGTGEFLHELSKRDGRVDYWPMQLEPVSDPAQGKCAARTMTLRGLENNPPDWVIVCDSDEFYTREDQRRISETLARCDRTYTACAFGLRTVWRPPSIAHEPLFKWEAKGGVWSVPVCRAWRYVPGMEYRSNHNSPEAGGRSLALRMAKHWRPEDPACAHLGFAASLEARQAKHRYYEARGEGKTDHRGKYVACRRAWETWTRGRHATANLPPGCLVLPWRWPVPEVFRA